MSTRIAAAVKSVAVVAATVTLGTLVAQAPASAHDTQKWWARAIDGAYAGYARVYQSHQKIQVCDTYGGDGEGVYAEWFDTNGGYHTTSDTNGSATGCGYGTAPSGTTIYEFNMRSRQSGSVSSGWHYA